MIGLKMLKLMQQKIWNTAERYAGAFVDAVYADDAAVAADVQLAQWVESARTEGNLPTLAHCATKAAAKDLLTFVAYTPLTHTLSNADAMHSTSSRPQSDCSTWSPSRCRPRCSQKSSDVSPTANETS